MNSLTSRNSIDEFSPGLEVDFQRFSRNVKIYRREQSTSDAAVSGTITGAKFNQPRDSRDERACPTSRWERAPLLAFNISHCWTLFVRRLEILRAKSAGDGDNER